VDSLVNGLYEYRCECTNDQFNQLILRVELSTNPVLATYKKIDSFSDLIGINVFDMDSYAAGCDSRISKSDTITTDMIKYWLNVQNDQIVQRQLDLAGSASIGTYSIDFTGGNVISGSVPVNGSIRDNILYRKKISGSAFDYSLTNCTIEGWVIDYLQNQNDLSNHFSIITAGIDTENAYDDDPNTYGSFAHDQSTYAETLKLDLQDLYTVNNIMIFLSLRCSWTGYTAYAQIQISVDGSTWETLFTDTAPYNGYAEKPHIISTHVTNPFRYIRMLQAQNYGSGAVWSQCRIYDISLFE